MSELAHPPPSGLRAAHGARHGLDARSRATRGAVASARQDVALAGANLAKARSDHLVLALDPAASELFEEGAYPLRKSDGSRNTSDQMVELWAGWVRQYPIWSIEDGLAEDDWRAGSA